MTNITSRPEPMLWLDGARGIYIPQNFAERMNTEARALHVTGVSATDWAVLEAGPDHEWYWDTWADVLDNARVIDELGTVCHVYQDGDVWLVPCGMEWDDEREWFVWPDEPVPGGPYEVEQPGGCGAARTPREALHAAVERAIAGGAPVYREQRARYQVAVEFVDGGGAAEWFEYGDNAEHARTAFAVWCGEPALRAAFLLKDGIVVASDDRRDVAQPGGCGAARRRTSEFDHYEGCRGRDPDNCSGCALTTGRRAPNYSAWPLAYMENDRVVPARWRAAFKCELASENEAYAANLRSVLAAHGVRFTDCEDLGQ